MCSFTVLGVIGGVRGGTLLLRIELIRLLIVARGMLVHSSSMFVRSCWILEHAVVYANPEHPKHAQWVTCPMNMLAMQELGCFQLPGIVYISLQHGPCIIMLQHEVMVVDEWHNNGPQDLITGSVHSKCHQ